MTQHQIAAIRREELKNAGLDKYDLTIEVGGVVYDAHLSGTGLDFPIVRPCLGYPKMGAPHSFAWETIVDALKHRRPLKT